MSNSQRGRPREFDTDTALDTAVLVFWRKGYEGAGVSELCTAMGIAKQSMYDWVGDKRGLYIAALERYAVTHICGLRDMLGLKGSPIANLRHCLYAMAEYAKAPQCDGCFLTNAENEFGISDPEISRVVHNVEGIIIQAFTDVLERAKDAGEVPASLDCAATASALAVLRNGLMVAGRSGQSDRAIDQTIVLIEALLRQGTG